MPPVANRHAILIVEDDPAILRGLKDSFEYEGYRTRCAVDGNLALELAEQVKPAVILLDIMLPGRNGFDICQTLRQRGNEVPIIMLTAKNREEDVVLGLNLGADDYVTKPFRIRELHARVRRLLDKREDFALNPCHFGDVIVDPLQRQVTRRGVSVKLQPKEFDLLIYLIRQANRVVTRDQILDHVWGTDHFVTDRSVDRCITSLRKKLESDPRRPRWIKTIHRVGYTFAGEL